MPKICSTCRISKDVSAFSRYRQSQDGYQPACKDCQKIYKQSPRYKEQQKQYRVTHHEDIAAYRKTYVAANHEKIYAYNLAYSLSHPEMHPKAQRKSRAKHREKRRLESLSYRHTHLEEQREKGRLYEHAHQVERRANQKIYRIAHRQEMREKDRLRRLNNLEKYRARERAYDALHRAERNAKAALRKALKKGASRGVPIKHLDIAERDNWLCHICHTKVRQHDWSLDHLIPLSKGGLHIPENVALAHKLCNNRRFVGNTIPAQLRLLP